MRRKRKRRKRKRFETPAARPMVEEAASDDKKGRGEDCFFEIEIKSSISQILQTAFLKLCWSRPAQASSSTDESSPGCTPR